MKIPILAGGTLYVNQVLDWKGAIVRCGILCIAFAALFFAVGKNKQ
jgi:hypothetical protein